MSMKITKDFSGLRALKKKLEQLSRTELEWGFFEEDKYGPENDNLPVAHVALQHEQGNNFIPRRPFFSEAIEKLDTSKVVRFIQGSLQSGPIQSEHLLNQLGQMIVGDVKEEIENWTTPPNSAMWTLIKASLGAPTKPLEFTGQMLNSVKFKIRKRRNRK